MPVQRLIDKRWNRWRHTYIHIHSTFFLQSLRKTGHRNSSPTSTSAPQKEMCGEVLQLHLRGEKKPEADHQDSRKGHRCPSPTSGSYLLCLSEKTELKRSSLAAHTLHSVFFDSHLFPPLWQVQGHKSRNRKTQKQLLSEGLNFTLSHVVHLSFALS